MKLPDELAFLEDYFTDSRKKYQSARWLLSDFFDSVWEYSFDYKSSKKIDWDVKIDDGASLLDPRHKDLLYGFKYWLVIATFGDLGNDSNGMRTQSQEFSCTLALIDHFLLFSEEYALSKTGLAGISEDQLKEILNKSSLGKSSTNLLDWERMVSDYIFKKAYGEDFFILKEVLGNNPCIGIVTPCQENNNSLPVDVEDIPLMRAWLYSKNLYKDGQIKKAKLSELSKLIYPNTIMAKNSVKPDIEILFYSKYQDAHVGREMPGVPVNRANENKNLSESGYLSYHRSLYKLSVLHVLGIPAPSKDSFKKIQSYMPETSKAGRFSTLPTEVVFKAFRNAIEFDIKFGEALVDTYCRLALIVKRKHRAGHKGAKLTNLSEEEFNGAIDYKLKEIGVSRIGLSVRRPGSENGQRRKGSPNKYFKKLRRNEGLLELLSVYIGCVQIVIGTIMARRHGEMININVDSCLDASDKWLIFANEKSTRGMYGFRNIEARPIDPIGVKMLKKLILMQKELKNMGVVDDFGPFYSTPDTRGFLKLTTASTRYNKNLDMFCDYFETGSDRKGRRYYIRQHNLRRFFAMLFFYSSAFGGVDTLRWMLGHTDLEHMWHYITESTPGQVLRATKSHWAAENLTRLSSGNTGFSDLVDLIYSRFHVKEVSLVDAEDLESMIDDLLLEGKVKIEPEFFEDGDGKKMQIMCKVEIFEI